MKENLHDIDKLFKAAIEDHEEAPAAGVWESIDQHLDKNKVVNINRKYLQLKRIAVALLILLLGAGVYTLNTWKTSRELVNRYNTRNSAKYRDTATFSQSRHVSGKLIVPGSKNADKNFESLHSNKMEVEQSLNKTGPGTAGAPAESPAFINSTRQTGTAIINSTRGRKIIIDKRAQKTSITNADYANEENGITKPISIKNENEVTRNLAPLPAIVPELIKAWAAISNKKTLIQPGNLLPNDLFVHAPPGKTNKVRKAALFAATLFYAPNISSNHIKDDKRGGFRGGFPGRPGDDRDSIRDGEHHQLSTTFGLLIDYNINKHWSLQSGISLTNKTIHINPKTIYADLDDNGEVKYLYNCSSGYMFLPSKPGTNPVVGDSAIACQSTNTLQYASIPLAVKYTWSFKKIDFFTSIGASINILTKDKIVTGLWNGPNTELSVSDKINGLQSAYFGGAAGFGATYNITDKIGLSFFPSYNFAFVSATRDATVKTYPNTISFAAGLRYRL